jgi:CopG family transcriptional regulator, nickel-responsive regulator
MPVARIGVSLEGPLLKEFDRLVLEGGYRSRSEALRNLIRKSLANRRVTAGGRAVGTITFLYRHDVGMVTHRILHGQHAFLPSIRASAHAHLGEETCLEVVIMQGSPRKIAELTDRLKAVRGVLFAEAVTTSPDLP